MAFSLSVAKLAHKADLALPDRQEEEEEKKGREEEEKEDDCVAYRDRCSSYSGSWHISAAGSMQCYRPPLLDARRQAGNAASRRRVLDNARQPHHSLHMYFALLSFIFIGGYSRVLGLRSCWLGLARGNEGTLLFYFCDARMGSRLLGIPIPLGVSPADLPLCILRLLSYQRPLVSLPDSSLLHSRMERSSEVF